MAKTGILGGSFNPPHLAHIALGEDFAKRLCLDKILITPVFLPPHKDGSFLAPCEDRLNMCRLAIKGKPIFEICDIEMKRGGKSYSYDTLKQLRLERPCDEFFFLIGSDMLLSFDKWFRYKDILKMCTVCAAARENGLPVGELEKKAQELTNGTGSIIISKTRAFEISSTKIRALLKSGGDAGPFLDERVLSYINERGLYRGGCI